MPTDVNNLKHAQKVAVTLTAHVDDPEWSFDVIFLNAKGEPVSGIDPGMIVADWPPEPRADEAGWETESTFRCVDPDLHSFFVEPEMGFQYRVQRRPIAPKWVPTVGEKAGWGDEIVTVNFIGKNTAHVTHDDDVDGLASLHNLTQPKEQLHDQD